MCNCKGLGRLSPLSLVGGTLSALVILERARWKGHDDTTHKTHPLRCAAWVAEDNSD